MFKNQHKQQTLEKVRQKFLGWIKIEADPELEILQQGAIRLETTALQLKQINSEYKAKELVARYKGNLPEDLKYIERIALEMMNRAIFLQVKMVFSLLLVVIAALFIFLIPTPFFSIKSLSFLPEDWRSDLEKRIERLKKANKSRLFIRFKKVQFLLELLCAGIATAWDNLWLSENENAG